MPGNATQRSAATPPARWPVELTGTFLRFEQERLIGLDNAIQGRRSVKLDPIEEAMTPSEGCVAVHADPICPFAHGQ